MMKLLTDCNGKRFAEMYAENGERLLINVNNIEHMISTDSGTSIMMSNGIMIYSKERYEDIRYCLLAPSEAAIFDWNRSDLIDGKESADTRIFYSALSDRSRDALLLHFLHSKKDPTYRDVASMTRGECAKLLRLDWEDMIEIEFRLDECGLKFKDEESADTRIIASNLPIHLRRILNRRLQKVKKDPTIRDIASMTKKEFAKMSNVGREGSEKIEAKLAEYGLKFKDEMED